MKKKYLAIALLTLTTCLCAEDSKRTQKEDPSVVIREETIGNVKVIAKGKNLDPASQHRIEFKKWQKQHTSEKKKNSRFRDREEKEEDKDDDSTSVSFTFKWPAKD